MPADERARRAWRDLRYLDAAHGHRLVPVELARYGCFGDEDAAADPDAAIEAAEVLLSSPSKAAPAAVATKKNKKPKKMRTKTILVYL